MFKLKSKNLAEKFNKISTEFCPKIDSSKIYSHYNRAIQEIGQASKNGKFRVWFYCSDFNGFDDIIKKLEWEGFRVKDMNTTFSFDERRILSISW